MITDKMLAAAAAELNSAMLDRLPDSSDCIHRFSSRFEKKMRHLIRKTKYSAAHRIVRRAAGFILVLFLSFMTLLTISPTVRAAFFGWIQEQYDHFTHFYFSTGETQNQDPVNYALSYLPEGYAEFKRTESPTSTTIWYANYETNQIIHFTYSKIHNSVEYFYKIESQIDEEIMINGQTAIYVYSDDPSVANILYWTDKSTSTFLCISAYVEKTELIMIAEKIIKISK